MIGDPLLGPAGDDGEGASSDDEPATAQQPIEPAPPAIEPEPGQPSEPTPVAPHGASEPELGPVVSDPTRVVPAPVLPPGGLRPGAPPPSELDPLWAATTARPGIGAPAAPPPGAPTGEIAATTTMPAVAADDMTATTAMPGVARSIGPHDTMVMPAVAAQAPAPGAAHAPGFEKAMRRHRRRWWRRSCKALLLVIVAGIIYVGVNLALVIRTANTDQARPVDVIVVLGAAQYNGTPSPQLQARLDHTVDLWNEGFASVVFVTGGKQPGDQHTEAESSRDYLVEHGVPADAIQMEDQAHSTWESLSSFAEVADAQGWHRVLLVTDPFHSLRSRLIAQELGFSAYTSPTQTSPVQGREELMKEIKEALGISLGRIIGFERLWKVTG